MPLPIATRTTFHFDKRADREAFVDLVYKGYPGADVRVEDHGRPRSEHHDAKVVYAASIVYG